MENAGARNITKEEMEEKIAEYRTERPDRTILLETPADDAKLLAELLGIEEATLPNAICSFAKGNESCSNCGRNYSILDSTKSGLQVHSKEFLIDTLCGKNGYILNDSVPIPSCYNCGKKTPEGYVYATTYYACGC